jgi:hypothetical protein
MTPLLAGRLTWAATDLAKSQRNSWDRLTSVARAINGEDRFGSFPGGVPGSFPPPPLPCGVHSIDNSI